MDRVISVLGTVTILAVAAAMGTPSPLNGQHDCFLKVERDSEEAGYQSRNGRYCEGTYVALQSSPLNVQVISFTRGGDLSLPAVDSIVHLAPAITPEAVDSLAVIGRTRRSNVNWALDARLSSKDILTWDLQKSVRPRSLEESVGIYARFPATPSPLTNPVFIPVVVRPPGDESTEPGPDRSTLIVKLPGASGVKWRFFSSDAPLAQAQLLAVDGYFRLEVPPAEESAGTVDTLAIYWRERGELAFRPVPELLQIVRP